MQLQSHKKQIILTCLLTLSAITFPVASVAITVQEVPNPRQVNGGWVTDKANILSDSTENQLDRIISDLEAKNGSEIAVVTVPDTKPSVTPKAFATQLFNYWGIGKKGTNNGVLLLISAGERRIEIETGAGIQGILPNSKVVEIINYEIKPRFQQQDFNSGTLAGTKALVNILEYPKVTLPATSSAPSPLPLAPIVPSRGEKNSDKNLPTATPSPVISNSTSTDDNSSSAIDGLFGWSIVTPIAIVLIIGGLGLFISFILVSVIVRKFRRSFSRQSPVPSSCRYQGNYRSGNSTRNNPNSTTHHRNYSVNNYNYSVGNGNYNSSDCDAGNYSSSNYSSSDCNADNYSSSNYSSGEYSSNSSDCSGSFGGGESTGGGAGSNYSSNSGGSFGGGESTGGGAGSNYSSSSSSSDYSSSSSSSSSSDYSSSSSSSSSSDYSSSSSDCSGAGGSW